MPVVRTLIYLNNPENYGKEQDIEYSLTFTTFAAFKRTCRKPFSYSSLWIESNPF